MLYLSQILDVNVGSQPYVVRQIPAIVIRIFVDYDLVSAPVPAIAVAEVVGRNTKIETSEPEALAISALNTPYMIFAKSTCKVAALPGVIQVVVRIVGPAVMPNPFVVRVHVRRVRMSCLIAVMLRLLDGMFRWVCRCNVRFWMRSRRTMRGNMPTSNFLRGVASAFGRVLRAAMFLRDYGEGT